MTDSTHGKGSGFCALCETCGGCTKDHIHCKCCVCAAPAAAPGQSLGDVPARLLALAEKWLQDAKRNDIPLNEAIKIRNCAVELRWLAVDIRSGKEPL